MSGVRKPPNIALLGADDPLGEAFLRLLTESAAEVGQVFALSLDESEGCVSARGEELPLADAADFDWREADIVINATRAVGAGKFEVAAAEHGCRLIGLAVEPVAPDRIKLDNGLAIALGRVLAPIKPLASVSVVAMLPVGVAGEAGVAELASQTRALFAMESPEAEVFPLQIAFNLIPQVGTVAPDGASLIERDTEASLRQMLGVPDLPVMVTAMWAPLFYGAALAVQARGLEPIEMTALREKLAAHPGVTLMDAVLPGGVATPATDALDSDKVFVSRLRRGADPEREIAMWLVIDMLRLEAGRMMACLENLIEQ